MTATEFAKLVEQTPVFSTTGSEYDRDTVAELVEKVGSGDYEAVEVGPQSDIPSDWQEDRTIVIVRKIVDNVPNHLSEETILVGA